MVLINDDGYKTARVNLIAPENRAQIVRKSTYAGTQGAVVISSAEEQGKIAKLKALVFGQPVAKGGESTQTSVGIGFDPIQLSGRGPREVEFTIEYGKGNSFKGGEHLDVVSGWKNTIGGPHVWGAVLGKSRPANHLGDIQLPMAH
jgi:hypothetical protein